MGQREVPEFALEMRQAAVVELIPRSEEQTRERIEYIREQIQFINMSLSSLERGLATREGMVSDGMVDNLSNSQADGHRLNYPSDVMLRDQSTVADAEVAGFYHFFKKIEARSRELFKLVNFKHQDEIERDRRRLLDHMGRVHPFYYRVLIPIMDTQDVLLVENKIGGRFYYPTRVEDYEGLNPLTIDLNIEKSLRGAIGEIEPFGDAMGDEPQKNWTHIMFLDVVDKDKPNLGKRIVLNIYMKKDIVYKMRAKYCGHKKASVDETIEHKIPINTPPAQSIGQRRWWKFWERK